MSYKVLTTYFSGEEPAAVHLVKVEPVDDGLSFDVVETCYSYWLPVYENDNFNEKVKELTIICNFLNKK